jgi:checkpoint serine/threonine-protein kinase
VARRRPTSNQIVAVWRFVYVPTILVRHHHTHDTRPPAARMTAPLVNFDAIEQSKENIAPTPRGRSAIALAKAFDVTAASPHDARSQHASTRAKFEHDIASSTDLDDPLEVWVRYIKWTDETFPSGQSTESGIARLLERCTTQFKNDKQYKSDPRYLRVWLAYSTYSDSPLEIFRFLQHHDIGQDLALYYEEYAAVLEKVNRKRKADEIFQIGLLREARPVDRLRRRYAEFQRRLETSPPDAQEPTTPPAPLRKVLGTTKPLSTAGARGGSTLGPRPKMQVFADTEEPEGPPGSAGWESIGTLAERKKENSMAPKPWAGEKLPMKGSSAASTGERLVVFRDEV